MSWECGIAGCGAIFEDVEAAIVHQASDHERRECKVCGADIPDGYLAIHHAFTEHSRAEYVRAYGADSKAVRQREALVDDIEALIDRRQIADQLPD